MADVHPTTGTGSESNVVETAEFGAWTNHQIPEDRSGWHPLVRRFYEYWLSVAPPGRLPGRQHVRPEEIVPLLPRVWMLDIYRDPLRFCFRLAGTNIVDSVGGELTALWLDEAQPELVANPMAYDRYRFVTETGRSTWRRGAIYWKRDPTQRSIETCMVLTGPHEVARVGC
jgi:hypothetical protein